MKSVIIGIITVAIIGAGGLFSYNLLVQTDDEAVGEFTEDVDSAVGETAKDIKEAGEAADVAISAAVADVDYDITAKNFSYSETNITAEAGQIVSVTIESTSGTHDFVIDELNVRSKIFGAGSSDTVKFTIPESAKSGDIFEFYCSIGDHRAQGMEGTVTVL